MSLPLTLIVALPVCRFFALEPFPNTTFGCRVSASQKMMLEVMDTFQVSPHFTNLLLGQYTGNHMPPADFQTYNGRGEMERLGSCYLLSITNIFSLEQVLTKLWYRIHFPAASMGVPRETMADISPYGL